MGCIVYKSSTLAVINGFLNFEYQTSSTQKNTQKMSQKKTSIIDVSVDLYNDFALM